MTSVLGLTKQCPSLCMIGLMCNKWENWDFVIVDTCCCYGNMLWWNVDQHSTLGFLDTPQPPAPTVTPVHNRVQIGVPWQTSCPLTPWGRGRQRKTKQSPGKSGNSTILSTWPRVLKNWRTAKILILWWSVLLFQIPGVDNRHQEYLFWVVLDSVTMGDNQRGHNGYISHSRIHLLMLSETIISEIRINYLLMLRNKKNCYHFCCSFIDNKNQFKVRTSNPGSEETQIYEENISLTIVQKTKKNYIFCSVVRIIKTQSRKDCNAIW